MKGKLRSRKFWVAAILIVSGLLLAFGVDADTVERVTGAVTSMITAVAYIIAESCVDVASTGEKDDEKGEHEE